MKITDDMIATAVEAHGVAAWTTDDYGQMQAAIQAVSAMILEEAAKVCELEAKDFLSPDYATGQPLSSIQERLACKICAAAIRKLTEGTQ